MDLLLFGKLKAEVERVFRKKILAYSDCLQLSDEIYLKTGQRLNVNTLRRCYNLVASKFNPSASTLNVLSVYCGFTCFQHFTRTHNDGKIKGDQSHILSEYLSFMISKLPFRNDEDATYIDTIRNTIIFLERYPSAIDSFQRAISKTRAGQELYFEQFVNVDQLNGYYGEGLRYYLAEKKTRDAQIFGNTLLVWRYWLTEKDDELQEHYKALCDYSIDSSMPSAVIARYFQSQILWSEGKNEAMALYVEEARNYYKAFMNDRYSQPFFEAILANAFLLAKLPEEALYYIEKGKAKLKTSKSYFNSQIFYAFYLFEVIAYTMLGKNEKAIDLLSAIKTTNFYFLAVQYHTILLMVTQKKLGRLGNKEQHLLFLIEQTGFTRLSSLYD